MTVQRPVDISVADPSEVGQRKDLEDAAYQLWKKGEVDRSAVEEALRGLLVGHARAVMYSILRRADESLVSDAVNKVMLNLPEFRGESLFTTWAHRILMGVMYDQRRFDRRRKEVSMDTPGFDLPGDSSPAVSDLILTVKQSLSAEDYAIFEQVLVWGRSHEEAAEELKMSKATLTRHWERIKRKLQHVFGK